MKILPVSVSVEPEEASSIFNAYDTLRAALFFYLKEIDIPQGTLDDLSVLDYHISSLRDGILRQVMQE